MIFGKEDVMTMDRLDTRSEQPRRREEDLAYDVIEAPDLTDHPMIFPALPRSAASTRLENISEEAAIDELSPLQKEAN